MNTRSYAHSRLNVKYFRVLKNSTNQADKEELIKGVKGGKGVKKRDARHYNQEWPDSEVKISSGQKVLPFFLPGFATWNQQKEELSKNTKENSRLISVK